MATDEDCLRWYGVNATCEKSGHVWLARGRDSRNEGPQPLFVTSEINGKYYLSGKYGRMERRAAWCLDKLMERGIRAVSVTIPDTATLGETQLAALAMASSNPISVITGGPGTGKTTIAQYLAAAHSSVLGLSPTGKGADRLGESLAIQCYTAHRAVRRIIAGELDLTQFDLIAIDETGMLDTETAEMIAGWIYRSKTMARVVFLGDPGQLPSVGPGRVLDELIACLPTTKLDIIYRYSDSDIGMACENARDGHLYEAHTPVYNICEGDLERVWIAYRDMKAVHGTMETRVITYHRKDAAYFNNIGRMRVQGNAPVVCLRNNYTWNVFNGQCGYQNKDGSLQFGHIRVSPNRIWWTYSYGSTCHRSQGGQWHGVVVWIPSARYIGKEWLLTALSRSIKNLSVVVRNAAVTESCLASAKPASRRISLLGAFIKGEAKWVR